MESNKESPKELTDGNIQLAKGSCDHLPDDGADEKLVPDDSALKTNKDASEVKFISVDSQNGDAKIDIENMKIAFAGMGKEELMKFANDPFWVRLRWSLFISFWLLWVAMLAGAVTIIVMAPKCAAPAPLKWWEQSPLYQVFVPAFKDGEETQDGIGDLKGLQSKLDYIEDLGVKGVALSSIVKVSTGGSDEAVEDFKDIDARYGTLEEFRSLITSLKSKGLHLVLSLVPNHSSKKHPWFVKSERNDTQYKDYYIWSSGPPKYNSEDGTPEPPNNWMSVQGGGSAWEWSEVRKAFYLHQFHVDEPDLNFTNPAVIEEFKEIFKFWLDHGVSGFQLEKVEYLLEDPNRQDEALSRLPGVTHNEYNFYSHTRTMNQPGIVDVLAEWKKVIQNNTDGTKVLSVVGSLPLDTLVDQNGNTSDTPVDLLHTNTGFYQLKNGFTASDLNKTIQKYLDRLPDDTRPTWQLSTSVLSRVASRLSYEYVDGLNMIAMLLPGTPITLYGEEIGMEDAASGEHLARCVMSWSNATNAGFSDDDPLYHISKNYETVNVKAQSETAGSSLSLYKELVEARATPSIMYGTREFAVIGNNAVFAFTRIKSGNPGYLVAFNTADEEVTVSFSKLKYVPEDLNVLMKSSNFNSTGIKAKSKLNRDSVVMSARGALVTTFVPKLE